MPQLTTATPVAAPQKCFIIFYNYANLHFKTFTMTKKYRYNQALPFSAARMDGQINDLIRDGEIVTTSDNVSYVTKNKVAVSVSEEALRKYFTRIYSFEEQQRYAHIWEKAMLAAMQGIITGIASNEIPVIHHEVADLSLAYADLMIAKLKEREF